MAGGKSVHAKSKRERKSRFGLWVGLGLAVLLAAYLGVLELSRPHVSGDRLRFDTFVRMAESGQIRTAFVLDVDSYVVGIYDPAGANPAGREDAGVTGDASAAPQSPANEAVPSRPTGTLREYNVPLVHGTQGTVLRLLVDSGIPTVVDQQPWKRVATLATTLLPALILVLVALYLIVSFRRGTGLFGLRSGARRLDREESTVTFADVAGQEAAVVELREVRDFLAEPERFSRIGAIVPKGILLFGPPGCGKTLLARALAGEAGAAFYSISGSDFVELYAGVGAARVRDLFREARENTPAIVFIDELDSVGRRRGATTGAMRSNEEQEQALNQILAEMDGVSPMEGVVVLGATNRPDILDPALLRPGRFDRTIGLERPNEQGRFGILSVHARGKSLGEDVDLRAVAERAIGLSGADLAGVMNEAALLAARARRPAISALDLETALTRIIEAPERQRRLSMRSRSFGRSTGAVEKVTFADVAGVDQAIEELSEVRGYLRDPERLLALGARPPRGFLLVGPPGCGKTMLARALAVEANAAFFSVAATEFVELFAGEGAARVRDLFAEAKAAAPAIVFIDEIDAIGARRGNSADGVREREQTLNQILIELDGFDPRSGVTVLAASNRAELLDEALVRPGRFDRTIAIDYPDRASRRQILAVHAREKRLASDMDLDSVAAMTSGFSGADLANVLNEATLLTARRGASEVTVADVEEAIERVGVGIARAVRLSRPDRVIIAHHEIGHALVGRALPGAAGPRKVSIVSRGRALGASWQVEDVERVVHPKSALLDQMAALLGGRVAEELVFGEPASGAADDLKRATQLARRMVCELGMSDGVGVVSCDGAPDGGPSGHSWELARSIDVEVRLLLDEAHERARWVLTGCRAALEAAAQALLERETLSADELDEIVAATELRVSAAPS